jgi:2-dehydropantoate 2-reductase
VRILSFGAGAIGTYIGGALQAAGAEVVFVERPEAAADVVAAGRSLVRDGAAYRLAPLTVVGSLAEALALGPFDAALFALKSFDTAAAAAQMAPYAAELPPLVCLQNGVENEALLAAALGPERVLAATVTSAIAKPDAQTVVVERRRGVGLADGFALSAPLADLMARADLNPRLYPDAAAMKWSKLLTNLLGNATAAILDLTPAAVFADAGLFRLELRMLREALAVMGALGLTPVDLPGTPVRLLGWAVRWLPPGLAQPFLARAVGGGRGGKMPSLHIDLARGARQLEVDYLNGAVARCGQELGVATPVNALLTRTLLDLASGAQPRAAYRGRPEALLRQA